MRDIFWRREPCVDDSRNPQQWRSEAFVSPQRSSTLGTAAGQGRHLSAENCCIWDGALDDWWAFPLSVTHVVIVCPMQFMALDRYKITWVFVCPSVRNFCPQFLSDLPQIWNVTHTSDKEEQVRWLVTSEVSNGCLGPQTSILGEKRTFSTENRLQWALSRVNYP